MKHQISISDDASKRVHRFQKWLNDECRKMSGGQRVEFSIHEAFEKIILNNVQYREYLVAWADVTMDCFRVAQRDGCVRTYEIIEDVTKQDKLQEIEP